MRDEKIMYRYAHTPDPFPLFFHVKLINRNRVVCGRPSCIELLQDGIDSTSTKSRCAGSNKTGHGCKFGQGIVFKMKPHRKTPKSRCSKSVLSTPMLLCVDGANHDWS